GVRRPAHQARAGEGAGVDARPAGAAVARRAPSALTGPTRRRFGTVAGAAHCRRDRQPGHEIGNSRGRRVGVAAYLLPVREVSMESAREWSSEIKDIGDKIMTLTLLKAQELGDYLKDVYGVEAAAAPMMAAGAGVGARGG